MNPPDALPVRHMYEGHNGVVAVTAAVRYLAASAVGIALAGR